jgi:hypothetical protein
MAQRRGMEKLGKNPERKEIQAKIENLMARPTKIKIYQNV